MNDTNQRQLGNTLWKIADDLRGAMNADDFRDYMLSWAPVRFSREASIPLVEAQRNCLAFP